MKSSTNKVWYVYLLLCQNGRLYTGITNDLQQRFQKHCAGKGAMFTKLNRPDKMLAAQSCLNRSEASKLEAAIKRLTPVQKRAIAAKWDQQKQLPN